MKYGRCLHATGGSWEPDFTRRHAAFAPLAALFGSPGPLSADHWPSLMTLETMLGYRGATNAAGIPLTLGTAVDGAAAAYEQRIGRNGEIAMRPGQWHDLFNVCMWALWPATKAALNRRHCDALAVEAGSRRSPARDALTAFDEDGIVIAVADPALANLVRGFRWRELFVDRRARLADAFQPFVFGHGLCEKLLAPFVGLTAKALLVPVDAGFARLPMTRRCALLDAVVARLIGDPARFASTTDLSPLPVLGLPNWWPGNEDPGFYDDANYFRVGRRRHAPMVAPA